jgi:YD repeat-containing protein
LTQYYQGSAPLPQGATSNTGTLLKTAQAQFESLLDLFTPFASGQPGSIFTVPTQTTTWTPRGSLTTEVRKYSGDSGIGQPLVVTTKIGCGVGFANSSNQCSPVSQSLSISYNVPVLETTSAAYGLSRSTTTTFEFQNPINQSYMSANMIALPLSVVTSDGASSGTTTYSYDENNGSPQGQPYGNLTSKAESYSMGGSVQTHTIYNSHGMPATKIDGNGNSTTISYDGTGMFASEIHSPTTNGVQHIDYYAYDSNTGALSWHTDENGSGPNDTNHTTHYGYDVMGRVTSIQYPDGGGSTFCYTDIGGSISGCGNSPGSAPYSLYTSTVATPAPAVLTVHSYDGWGRQYRSQVLGDSAGSTIVDTTYDWAGRVSSVSNPYRGGPASLAALDNPPCGNAYTCYTYDAFGRKKTQMQPDGFTQQWCYDGLGTYTNSSGAPTSCPTITWWPTQADFWDETWRHTQQIFDPLGRLVSVMEPDPVSGNLALGTGYTYDVFNDLLSVNQVGASGNTPVQRAFRYDMPSRVSWSCNPEAIATGQNCTSGSAGTNYIYDANSNLTQKTDNRGIITTYAYDALNRLQSKLYSDGTASSCFQYDGTSISNGVGRLAAQWTQKGACLSSSSVQTKTAPTSYDLMGRLLTEQRCMGISNCASGGYSMTYTYDLAGKLASYPSGFGGFSFANTYDAVGRLASVTNTSQSTTLFSLPTYTPAGALSGVQLGSSIAMIRMFDSRQRVTSESDYGTGNVGNVPGSASVTILGAEQKN